MGFTPKQLAFIFGMLITGTINTISKKLQLDCTAHGYFNHSAGDERTIHTFNKPWFQTLLMFLGEVLCLLGFFYIRHRKRKRIQGENYRRMESDTSPSGILEVPVFNWLFLLPASCDLLGTTLAGIGLLFVDASIWQMMRGSLIVFVGILSIIFLKRRLRVYHWCGMLCTVVGVALVGTKSVFAGDSLKHSVSHSILGVALVLAGTFVTACQIVLEEAFIKKRGFHPLQTVGMEGLFGTVLMIVIALPVVFYIPGDDLNGSYENFIDALYQIADSPLLLINCILYIFSIAFFNYTGLSITRYLTAVHRTLIDALRTTFVWLFSLVLFYSTGGRFGEPFNTTWGLIQIDGFAFLIIGTLIYNKVMDFSFIECCADPPVEADLLEDNRAALSTHSSTDSDDQLESEPVQSSQRTQYGAVDDRL